MSRHVVRVLLASYSCLLVPAGAAHADDTSVRLSNGVVMPRVSAGTWQYNDSVASAKVQAALSVGFTHIDTAFDYGNQRGVSMGLQAAGKPRKDLFITTKIPGCGLQGIFPNDCYGNTMSLIKEDLRQLSSSYPTEYIDLILIHFPPCLAANASDPGSPSKSVCGVRRSGCTDADNCKAVGEQWRAVQDAYSQGLVRAVGVSNYCSACFECLRSKGVQPMVNQVQVQVGMGPDPQGFLTHASKSGLVLQAWSPLGHGGGGDPNILHGDLTTGISRAHGKEPAQVALKWIVQHGMSVATKSSNPKHLAENLDIFSWDMSDHEMQALDSADFAKTDTPSFLCDDVSTSSEVVV